MSTREELIRAALALARRSGFGALSVRGVAREAGVGATTLRHHFPSQADLHRAVTAEVIAAILDDLAIDDDTTDPAVRLYDCLVQFLPDSAQDTSSRDSWFDLYRAALGPDAAPALRHVVQCAQEASAAKVRHWLSVLAEQHHVSEDDVEDQTAFVLAMINGLHLSAVVEPRDYDLPREQRLLRWYVRRLVAP